MHDDNAEHYNTFIYRPGTFACLVKHEKGLTRHIQLQLAFKVFTDVNPLVLAWFDLLEMYDVVPRGSVTVFVESKLVSA